MTLNFDTTRPHRRPAELLALASAIESAGTNDESEWLEWKSSLDLTSAEGRFHLARAILGMANRDPKRAARFCQGLGYVVVGVEPGNTPGVEAIDPAVLDDGLAQYLGGVKGPAWTPTFLGLGPVEVLVVLVEAPKAGDSIAVLRKSFNNASKGTVFVRKAGKTEPADDADMDLLQVRLRSQGVPQPELEVSVVGSLPLRWLDLAGRHDHLEAWIGRRADALLAAARITDEKRRRLETSGHPGSSNAAGMAAEIARLASLRNSMAMKSMMTDPDTRTLQEFEREVEDWTARQRAAAPDVLQSAFFDGDRNCVSLQITNPSDRNLSDVELKVHIPGESIKGLEWPPEGGRWPTPPRAFGEPTPNEAWQGLAQTLRMPQIPPGLGMGSTFPSRTRLEDGSINLTFHAGDLRPLEVDETDEIYVLLTADPGTTELVATWQATTKGADGVLRGEFPIAIDPAPITAADLLS